MIVLDVFVLIVGTERIDGTTFLCLVSYDDTTAYDATFQQHESTAQGSLTVGNLTVAYMCHSWYNGCTTHTLEARFVACVTVNQATAIYDGILCQGRSVVLVIVARRPFAEAHGVVAVHLLVNGRTFFYFGLRA